MRWILALAIVTTPAAAEPVDVVASFSILADIVKEVGGERVEVTALVPAGGDVHVYEPTPRDAARLAAARLVVVNGLGFEGWMERLVAASGSDARVVEASAMAAKLTAEEGDHETHAGEAHAGDVHAGEEHADEAHAGEAHVGEEHAGEEHASEAHAGEAHAGEAHAGEAHAGEEHAGEEHHHGVYDPHAWQDVTNVRSYALVIAAALGEVDPAGRDLFAANLARYEARLDALDTSLREALAPYTGDTVLIPHGSMQYFTRRYGLGVVSAQGLSTESEASAAQMAALIRRAREGGVDAIFVEVQGDRRAVEAIAAEAGMAVGPPLYLDTLSAPDGPAPGYIDMMAYNAAVLTETLARAKR